MLNISEIVKEWKKNVFDWSIAPAGYDWIKEGSWIRVGNFVTLGNFVKLGNYTTLGEGVTLGNDVTLISGTTFARDLGVQSCFRNALTVVDGKVKFVSDYHTFSFEEAKEYWEGEEDWTETLICVEMAEKLAKVIPETKDLM